VVGALGILYLVGGEAGEATASSPAETQASGGVAWQPLYPGQARRGARRGQAGLHRLHRRLVHHLQGERALALNDAAVKQAFTAGGVGGDCAGIGPGATRRSPMCWRRTAAARSALPVLPGGFARAAQWSLRRS